MKIFAFLYAFLFIVVNSHLNISMHFCNDELQELQLYAQNTNCCPSPCPACDDVEIKFEQQTDAYHFKTIQFELSPGILPQPNPIISFNKKTSILFTPLSTSAYPSLTPPKLYLHYCSLRLYA